MRKWIYCVVYNILYIHSENTSEWKRTFNNKIPISIQCLFQIHLRKNVFWINSLSSALIFLSSWFLVWRTQFLDLNLKKIVAFKIIRFIRIKKRPFKNIQEKKIKDWQNFSPRKKTEPITKHENCNSGIALSNYNFPTGLDYVCFKGVS